MSIFSHVPEGTKLRTIQLSILAEVEENWKNYDVFVIPAMVGAGKSVIAMTILKWQKSMAKKVSIITPQVVLQNQYKEDFPEVPVLKGKSRYKCILPNSGSCEDSFDICENYCAGCPYAGTKAQIHSEGVGVFNFHSFLFSGLDPDVLIVDEAHCIHDVLSSYYTKHMYKCQDGYGEVETIGDAIVFLEKKLKTLNAEYKQMRIDKDPAELKHMSKLKREIDNLHTVIGGVQANPKEFFFERKDTEFRRKPTEEINIKPLDLSNLSAVLWPKKGKVILMSGTINDMDIQKLGLSMRRVLTVNCPSAIDADRRPIEFIPVANMSYKHQDISVPIMAKYLLTLIDSHPGEKGLIHVPYALAVKLRTKLKHPRLMWHTNEDKESVYKEFRDTPQPAVLVASGMAEGIDLPYDAGRWQAILKIQYPSLADNLMKYFMNHESQWYSWLTIRTLVQQCGRICRGPDDYGKTYVLDVAFENLLRYNRRLMPKYFLDALHIIKRPKV